MILMKNKEIIVIINYYYCSVLQVWPHNQSLQSLAATGPKMQSDEIVSSLTLLQLLVLCKGKLFGGC